MKHAHDDIDYVANAGLQRPQGQVLKGQFWEVWRSEKGKIKGIVLRTAEQHYSIKLPKYLRPVLVRELAPHAFVQVWAYPDEGQWRGINIMPLSEPEAIALREAWADVANEPIEVHPTTRPVAQKPLCVQVCRKGKCFKRGGKQVLQALESEIAANPDLCHIEVEGVGCMKACKKGPNIKLSNSSKVINGVTPENALDLVTQHV